MLRVPVKTGIICQNNMSWQRFKSSSSIRKTFIEYFTANHGHKHVKSSSVVSLYDPTVPFVNAGMNQFKGVFLGKCAPPCLRAVNSQKCIRVGGKHNDLDAVGLDGHHHTFFEMLGNWSFGDYYKKEACQMVWELLLGPYQLKPENLIVTYFSGDIVLGLQEDRECRDIWKSIGVQSDRIKPMDTRENFWEMGVTGPCGPCSEIHYVNTDGSLTEIWNIVFIQYNRESNGSITELTKHHVDTGMGLERMATLMQHVPSNYDTDLFQPIIKAIEMKSDQSLPYSGKFGSSAQLDTAYRRLADHARMVSVCLADGAFPASSLNLKQIMRKSFKISKDIFKCDSGMLSELYDHVAESLGSTYPELVSKKHNAKKIIEHEEKAYAKLRFNLAKKWKDLVIQYPEVESLSDVELASFAKGYSEFKQAMVANNSATIPGEVVFRLYDTYGFQEDVIDRIAELNNFTVDKESFTKLLNQHKSRHKAAFKEQSNNNMALYFDNTILKLNKNGIKNTNDEFKYDYSVEGKDIKFKPLNTKLVAMLNRDGIWLDYLEANEKHSYYLIAESTNFYCEEGGQTADYGIINIKEDMDFVVDSIFKIRDYVFHKGRFVFKGPCENKYVKLGSEITLEVDSERRLRTMRNHTALHLLNAAIRKVLPNSVVCQVGSNVSDKGLVLNLSVYGDRLTQKVVMEAQQLVCEAIAANVPVQTSVMDSMQLSNLVDTVTVPGETYPDTGLRLVQVETEGFVSRELCCGTHLPSAGHVGEFCVTLVKGAGSAAPALQALTGDAAAEVHELSSRVRNLQEIVPMIDSDRVKEEIAEIKGRLSVVCGVGGAPYGEYGACVAVLDMLQRKAVQQNDMALHAVAAAEMRELSLEGRRFVVHFLRCSYLMESASVAAALGACDRVPALVLGCANGVINAACTLPESYVTPEFTASKWLTCILGVFQSSLAPVSAGQSSDRYAAMIGAKVSLITCEQLVQDAMRAAIRYAEAHVSSPTQHTHTQEDRRHN